MMRPESRTSLQRYRRLAHYPLSQWPKLVLILVLTLLSSSVTVFQPWPLKILVDYALGDTALPLAMRSFFETLSLIPTGVTLVITAAVATFALYMINAALSVGLTWTWAVAGQRMVYDLTADLFGRLQRLSLLFHSRRSVGDALSRLFGDTYCVYTATESILISPGQHIVTLLVVGSVAWNMDARLTLLTLAVAPAMAGSALFFGPRMKRWTRLNREIQSRMMSFVHQTLTAIPVVQAFGAEARNRQFYENLASDAVDHSQRSTLIQSLFTLANGLVATIGAAVVLYVGGMRVLSGALSLGSLLVFLAYLQTMQGAIKGLMGIYGSLKTVEASVDRVMDVMEAKEEVLERPGARNVSERMNSDRIRVAMENVSFGYEKGRAVLHDISLEAHPGETIALVGKTGAGKSTLASLIPRLYDPWMGRVTFNGVDVRELTLSSVRAHVGLMLQDPFLSPISVADNIAYGRPDATREEVIRAAASASADEFIRDLPEGYDTVISELGATLSGGQKQRLAIARVLLKDAPVLILDEPTSALDTQTEVQLLEALERLKRGRTTFIIAHRLSTIRRADRIVVLDEGRIVETGTHRELMHAEGIYHTFYSLQSRAPGVSA